MESVTEIAKRAKQAWPSISNVKTKVKNDVLQDIAESLIKKSSQIIACNERDVARCKQEGISQSLLDRLMLDGERIRKISEAIFEVIELSDPIGQVLFGYDLPNGLILNNIRVPLGVIGVIYEARPNVTVDAAVLAIKSSNATVLRGSSHAIETNIKLVEIMRGCLQRSEIDEDVVQIIESSSREDVLELMSLRKYIDVLIPRGGAGLIESVVLNAKVPVIETGVGNCHIYIDGDLGLSQKQVIDIVVNAKTQRPSVCNAAESLLIHEKIASKIIGPLFDALKAANVQIRGCKKTKEIYGEITDATEQDYYSEFLDLIISVKIVKDIDEAISHINRYSSKHTEAILTSNYQRAIDFTRKIDSSTVFVNASTRFTDGGQFGMGAEVGISTQKIHWRGPMGLQQLTTNKFVVFGQGQIRD